MNSNIYFIFLFLLCCISCKTGNTADPFQDKTAKIDSLGNRYLDLGRFSGAILVAKRDFMLYRNYFGLADYDNNIPFSGETAFEIGSISKIITADMIRQLAANGKINLSEPVYKYLPELEVAFWSFLEGNVVRWEDRKEKKE